jgi:hypothetical protein
LLGILNLDISVYPVVEQAGVHTGAALLPHSMNMARWEFEPT